MCGGRAGGLAILAIVSAALPAWAAPQQPAPVCQALLQSFDFEDRKIAMNFADGLGDDSVPRESERDLKDLQSRTQQLLAVELLRGHNCPLPSEIGGDVHYMSSALTCAKDRLTAHGADLPASCSLKDWKPDTPAGH